jgi:hypothetical protein
MKEKAMLECSKLQTKALHELNNLSCRVTMLDAALNDVDEHPLLAGVLTAVEDIQKSVDKAELLVDQLGIALPTELGEIGDAS